MCRRAVLQSRRAFAIRYKDVVPSDLTLGSAIPDTHCQSSPGRYQSHIRVPVSYLSLPGRLIGLVTAIVRAVAEQRPRLLRRG
jgi:hypothetical protein